MNSENVISLEAAQPELLPFRRVKVTASGIDYAAGADICIGHTLPGDLNRRYPSVQLRATFVEAELGSGTDVARGDTLAVGTDGRYIKWTTGTVVGVAWGAATEIGDRFDAFIFA